MWRCQGRPMDPVDPGGIFMGVLRVTTLLSVSQNGCEFVVLWFILIGLLPVYRENYILEKSSLQLYKF
jgi:hypothetical protein